MPSTKIFRRPVFRPGPEMPGGEVAIQEPPVLPETQGGGMSTALTTLPMALASGSMMLMFIQPGGAVTGYIVGGLMALSGVGMMAGQMVKGAGDRKRKLNGERRDYLRYLTQIRRQARTASNAQYQAMLWQFPTPQGLWSLALSSRLWERRPNHDDFGEVRLGLGDQRAVLALRPPQSKPIEDLDPISASALRRFIKAWAVVPRSPTAVLLRAFARVQFRAHPDLSGSQAEETVRGLARALIGQLTTLHAPDDLRIAFCIGADAKPHWDFVKWLPHVQHPTAHDSAGPVRLVTDSVMELERLLGDSFAERGRFEPNGKIRPDEPYMLIVLDGVALPSGSRIADAGFANTTVLDLAGALRWKHDKQSLRLQVAVEEIEVVGVDRTGRDTFTSVGQPDTLPLVSARVLAKLVSPNRLARSVESIDPLATDQELTDLLGIDDANTFDPQSLWATRSPWDKLKVPIGLSHDGTPVELDIKESAQGGMGPHGMLIGATGSGKSELLRTLVLALAVTHNSEVLNFVLVDFKGGATFLGLDQLPHTSAVITNLADELPLVDRMQSALHGEMVRRQELLRRTGYSSLADYERARASGTVLDPLPTLFVVVDEFSEMLSIRREMMELFVMIGRLGRSLGVHLLLASQRLEEGRIHQLESHLSYRIGLRTFSASESRSVLGVPDAYELPPVPGSGFLKTGTSTLTRFKAAYVSGPYKGSTRHRSTPDAAAAVRQQIVEYGTDRLEDPAEARLAVAEERETAPEPEAQSNEALMTILLDKLRDAGPAARQVWLPPLTDSPGLDGVLPPVEPHPDHGLSVIDSPERGRLRVPLGLVDLPFEGVRELLVADLAGGAGHVGVVGGPHSGKSTFVRTLILSLALTHTPREVQFYCLDFGGGALSTLGKLPHVGSVAGRREADRVTRTLAELAGLMAMRERLFTEHGIDSMETYRKRRGEAWAQEDPFGDVFLVIDGWYTFRQEFDALEGILGQISNRGLSYGIHIIVASTRWSEIRPWLRDMLGTRFELRLGDPVDSEVNARLAALVPEQPGRGLTRQGMHFVAAVPRIDGGVGPEGMSEASQALVEQITEEWAGPKAPPVRMLPDVLTADSLPVADGDLRVPVGLEQQGLNVVCHDFREDAHLLVFGDTESGKTNLLRVVARAIEQRYGPDEARVVLADYRRDLVDSVPEHRRAGYAVSGASLGQVARDIAEVLKERLPGPDITPEQLARRDWWSGPRYFVLVDDYELVSGSISDQPLAPLYDLLPQGANIGLHLVIARSSAGANRAMADRVLRSIWDLGSPALMLSCKPDEGAFLGMVKPKLLPLGRVQWITRRRSVHIVQTALVERG
ncbi:type VII secretion protein EccCa [Kitasatospora sp. NPDC093102]|uniref:type VII secretion protein EccCa n=1 Tax=Kitasatospora sp. NPDC093102 TaxID=3155069 RepID=UPI003429E9E9